MRPFRFMFHQKDMVYLSILRDTSMYMQARGVRKDSKNPPVEKDRNTDKTWSSRPYSDAVEILVPAAGVEVYVFAGPTALDAVRRFNLFNGGGRIASTLGIGFYTKSKIIIYS